MPKEKPNVKSTFQSLQFDFKNLKSLEDMVRKHGSFTIRMDGDLGPFEIVITLIDFIDISNPNDKPNECPKGMGS